MVDPHTYPDRPWPLSTLTVSHTDLYLWRSFQQIQDTLDPDTILFLGDLFDGGREWSTPPHASNESESIDKRWRGYGEAFWLKEYDRFGRIFFDTWLRGGQQRGQDRKIITSLPGNHDLGLGMGIRLPVRKRFNAYFGGGNRIDFIGNHSFVSLDTVSLSAKGQSNQPSFDQEGAEAQTHSPKDIWGPTEEFLLNAKAIRGRVVEGGLRMLFGKPVNELQDHEMLDVPSSRISQTLKPRPAYANIPSVVLTHVPLFRASGTPCGPLRERFPPSKTNSNGGESLEKDDRNAIKVQAGIQYQNVLTPEISKEVIEGVGDVEYIFSGDDHDYCDVVHRGYTSRTGGIREITVKSMSWAMGVRKPGFLMLSLWNPVDTAGRPTGSSASAGSSVTIQTHLCLLPDQLGIFIQYGLLLGLTTIAMLVRALIVVYGGAKDSCNSRRRLLPISKFDAASNEDEKAISAQSRDNSLSDNTTSVAKNGSPYGHLAARSNATRTRSSSPFNGYALPVTRTRAGSMQQRLLSATMDSADNRRSDSAVALEDQGIQEDGGMILVFRKFVRSILQIAVVALPWYIWLLSKT